MNQKAEALKARTRQFALDVFKLLKTLPGTPEGSVVRYQLAKSSSGVKANYRSACRSRSHKEFTARIGVVLDEADESEGWLTFIRDAEMSTSPDLPRLCGESAQLRAIFVASNLTAQSRRESSDGR